MLTALIVFKDYCKSQQKRKLKPNWPLWISEINGEWLKNLIEQNHQNNVGINPAAPVRVQEERKVNYFCPGCQEREAPVNPENPRNAICECGHIFCTDWYAPWGNEQRHIWRINQDDVNFDNVNANANANNRIMPNNNEEEKKVNISCVHHQYLF